MTKKETKKKAEAPRLASARGRTFQGYVTKKFPHRVVIEFERIIYMPKYERYSRGRTRLHARIPTGMEVAIGDYVKVQECRPLSKIIHFIVLNVVRKAENEVTA